jgi:hypothetical protein
MTASDTSSVPYSSGDSSVSEDAEAAEDSDRSSVDFENGPMVGSLLIEKIENNDSSVKRVLQYGIRSIEEGDELRFLQALQTNTHIEALWLGQERFVATEQLIELLLQFLRSSPSLSKLSGVNWENLGTVVQALQAISRNRKIQELHVAGMSNMPAEALAHLLGETKSLEILKIEQCIFTAVDGSVEDALSSGFARNTTLKHLTVFLSTEAHVVPILNAATSLTTTLEELQLLGPQTTLEELQLRNYGTLTKELVTSVGHLLPHLPIEKLHFCRWYWTADNYRPIAQGLKRSSSLTKVKFRSCLFEEGSTEFFREAFQGAASLRSLEYDAIGLYSSPLLLASVVGASDSSLKDLVLVSPPPGLRRFCLKLSLKALTQRNCQLESLVLSVTPSEMQELIQRIPRFRSLKILVIRYSISWPYRTVKNQLIRACWRNGSLVEIHIPGLDNNFDGIVARNQGLKRFREAPTKQPMSLWNSIFVRVLECDLGHDVIYDSLRGHVDNWLEAMEKWKEENKKLKQNNRILTRENEVLRRQNEGLKEEIARLKQELEKRGQMHP